MSCYVHEKHYQYIMFKVITTNNRYIGEREYNRGYYTQYAIEHDNIYAI